MRKAIVKTFFQMLVQIQKDMMLLAACFAPILASVLIRFGMPLVAQKIEVLKNYYIIFDIMISMITPIMFAFIGALVVLEEMDNNISNYLALTPVGKRGYFIARLGYPLILSFVISVVLLAVFQLSNISVLKILLVSLFQSAIGLMISLMIVSLSSNKVEGMAIGKISSIVMIGSFVPFFSLGNLQYIAAILPTYWIGKYLKEDKLEFVFLGVLVWIIESMWLWKKYEKKI